MILHGFASYGRAQYSFVLRHKGRGVAINHLAPRWDELQRLGLAPPAPPSVPRAMGSAKAPGGSDPRATSTGKPCAVFEPNMAWRWLMDTGCGSDLIRALDAAACSSQLGRGLARALNTANGSAKAKSTTRLHVAELGQAAVLCVQPRAPPALTTGRRCVCEGFSFIWKAGELPYTARPDGVIVPPSGE